MNDEVKTYAPERKVNVGGAMTFLSTMVAWGVGEFGGVTIPAEVGIAFAGFATYVAQYVVPNKK
jgi:hypothetical protein